MPIHRTERLATAAEIERMRRWLKDAPTSWQRWRQGAENALVLWAASMLALVVAWFSLAWLAGKVFAFRVGFASPSTAWVVGMGTFACAAFAVVSSVRWLRGWQDDRPLLQADLEGGRVVEERYSFVEAKRFQEPEHGGLIYFLLTSEGPVFALFDPESQELGVRGLDPLTSRFVPHADFVMVRAPRARYVISKSFSGAPLDVGAPLALAVDPGHWPASGELCDIPWSGLETRLCGRTS